MKKQLVTIALSLGALTTYLSPAQAAQPQCLPIGGEALGQFFADGEQVIAAMSGTWAAARGSVKSQKLTAAGLALEMEHAFSTSDGGVVRTRDVAELTEVPGKQEVYMLELNYTVTESFGSLKGYTGTFSSYGLFKMATGEALVRYSGEICRKA